MHGQGILLAKGLAMGLVMGMATACSPAPAATDAQALQDAQLQDAELQDVLARYESAVAWLLGPDRTAVQACWDEDRQAFAAELAACTDAGCRSATLQRRLLALEGWQADHQRVPPLLPMQANGELLAILAPEDGSVPPSSRTPQATREGVLVHAVDDPQHMGLAVVDADGTHVLVHDADLGNDDTDRELLELAATGVRVRVHGQPLPAANGIDDFDTSRCRRVYRLGDATSPESDPRGMQP
ncbi:hypothetical protein Psesu_3093 [Pseudoxanthomonas suwonensis 11-1]|uniref:Lipoprotein n=1 Tax=Pseudoxanthomonas suwonensis (strain 11-1) TaxID=743721 RepID=E6WXE7_PSEUU|nr:hypothetical protein [Pseudoxanthomonas suwonensis]ADV28916.1 hypothetical protein Psesu_3093 [Pseudoxanthomonas suwonensis 11-1]